jgi:hypothetical protein
MRDFCYETYTLYIFANKHSNLLKLCFTVDFVSIQIQFPLTQYTGSLPACPQRDGVSVLCISLSYHHIILCSCNNPIHYISVNARCMNGCEKLLDIFVVSLIVCANVTSLNGVSFSDQNKVNFCFTASLI